MPEESHSRTEDAIEEGKELLARLCKVLEDENNKLKDKLKIIKARNEILEEIIKDTYMCIDGLRDIRDISDDPLIRAVVSRILGGEWKIEDLESLKKTH